MFSGVPALSFSFFLSNEFTVAPLHRAQTADLGVMFVGLLNTNSGYEAAMLHPLDIGGEAESNRFTI